MNSNSDTQKFVDEIARLKELRQKLIQRTVEELDTYEKSIETKFEERIQEAHLPLFQEISHLKAAINQLEAERNQQATALIEFKQKAQTYHYQLQQAVENASSLLEIAPPRPTVHLPFPPTPLQVIEEIIPPLPIIPTPASVPQRVQSTPITIPASTSTVAPKKKKRNPLKTLVRRSFSLAVLIGISYLGWQAFIHYSPTNKDQASAGQVAGASTDQTITHPTQTNGSESSTPGQSDSYPESLVDVPLSDTQWEQSNDPDFGVNIQYPHNTSNRIHLPGGNNLWFLRKNSYMLKITKEETNQPLDQWIETNKSDFVDYTLSKGSFKNTPGWVGQSQQKTENSGTFYIIRHGVNIYQVWVKNFPEDSDDGQRLKKMINSLVFTT